MDAITPTRPMPKGGAREGAGDHQTRSSRGAAEVALVQFALENVPRPSVVAREVKCFGRGIAVMELEHRKMTRALRCEVAAEAGPTQVVDHASYERIPACTLVAHDLFAPQ